MRSPPIVCKARMTALRSNAILKPFRRAAGLLDRHIARGGEGSGVQCAADQRCFTPVEPPGQGRHTAGRQSRRDDLAVLDLQRRRHRDDRKFERRTISDLQIGRASRQSGLRSGVNAGDELTRCQVCVALRRLPGSR